MANLISGSAGAAAALAPSVTAALEAAGVDVKTLREFTQAKEGERFSKLWMDAAQVSLIY